MVNLYLLVLVLLLINNGFLIFLCFNFETKFNFSTKSLDCFCESHVVNVFRKH